MSNAASIPQLLRIHFSNIGHNDARLSPLTLNFQRETDLGAREPVDSIIWAENGVGKSSIRTLLFSLLHPSINDVMRSSNGPLDNRKYELFFGPTDTAFVLTEWQMPPSEQIALEGFIDDPNTLIIGFVAHWPTGARTSLSDLDRHFFLFRPQGMVTFERMPVRGLAEGGLPVNSAREFLDWFKEHTRHLGGRQTTVHREWLNWLGEVGLDPMIFTYQLRMNGGQGGILGLFKNRINTATDFVHFFLETVLSADTASDVIEVLEEKRRHLEKQPQWEAECAFVDEAIPLLRQLQVDKDHLETAARSVEADQYEAGAWLAGLERVMNQLKQKIADLGGEIEDNEIEIRQCRSESVKLTSLRNWLRHRELALKLEQAESELARARIGLDTCRSESHKHRAAAEYVEWQAKLDECRAIEKELEARKDSNLDVIQALKNAGTAYAQVLDREIKRAAIELEEGRRELNEAKKLHAQHQKDGQTAKSELGQVRGAIQALTEKLANREKSLQRLILAQALNEGEEPEQALARWDEGLEQARNRLEKTRTESEVLEQEKRALVARQKELLVEESRLRTEIEQLRRQLSAEERRKAELEEDADLKRFFANERANLADPELLPKIRQRIAHFQHEVFRFNRILHDKKDTLETLERSDSRLYPPPREVAQLLRTLREDLNIPAFLATEELDRLFPNHPARAESLFAGDPARYLGIMVHSREALNQIRESQEQLERPAFPVQVSIGRAELGASEADGTEIEGGAETAARAEAISLAEDALVLRPGHQAAFNRKVAADLVDPLRAEIAAIETRISDFQQGIKRLSRVQDQLEKFLRDYPEASLRVLAEALENQNAVLEELQSESEGMSERLQLIETELSKLLRILGEARAMAQGCESHLSRLHDFMEDHEALFRNLLEQLQERRTRLHQLEDLSMRHDAALEEDQLAIAERQEMVFNRKAALEGLEDQLRAITHRGGVLADVTRLTLIEAQDAYRLADERYRNVAEKDETLRARWEEKLTMASQQEKRFRKELGQAAESEIAAILAEGPLEPRLREAEEQERAAEKAVGACENAINTARQEQRELQPIDPEYALPKGEPIPTDVEQARTRRKFLGERVEQLLESAEQLRERQESLKESQRQLQEKHNLRESYRREIANMIPDAQQEDAREIPAENEVLKREQSGFLSRYRHNRKRHSDMKLMLDHRCDKLKDLASDARFQEFPNDKREILKVRDSLLRLTEDIIKEFLVFREVIQTSLRLSEASVEAIVTRLDSGVSDALHILNLAKSSSRLPDSMEGWGGRSFLKIEAQGQLPEGLEGRKPVYERVLREVLRSGKPVTGLELVKRAVDALVGEKGFKVGVMKPGYALKTNYHGITDVKGWSDGEKITSVILLYCTMVQLRAHSTGGLQTTGLPVQGKGLGAGEARNEAGVGRPERVAFRGEQRRASNGMLFLDNPFGEANSLTFVRMQLSMARALNIQLIYTASGSHKHLMARFPRVVRLSQEQGSNSPKTYVKATDVSTELRAAVNATNVTAAHFGRKAQAD